MVDVTELTEFDELLGVFVPAVGVDGGADKRI